MKVKRTRREEEFETNKVAVEVDGYLFTITEDPINSGLVINKVDIEGSLHNICIRPGCSNEIKVS